MRFREAQPVCLSCRTNVRSAVKCTRSQQLASRLSTIWNHIKSSRFWLQIAIPSDEYHPQPTLDVSASHACARIITSPLLSSLIIYSAALRSSSLTCTPLPTFYPFPPQCLQPSAIRTRAADVGGKEILSRDPLAANGSDERCFVRRRRRWTPPFRTLRPSCLVSGSLGTGGKTARSFLSTLR